ncbi:MAG: NAD(P)-dependent oxidoreductase [Gemmatimonadetes bacterium]|nr:NAD(P)-dependent oxidoreductase [Gemmatimonadota bacterium]
MSLQGKTLFVTGASRGIGLAIALRAARDGANVAIVAKTDAPSPKLPGTVFTAAAEIEQAGGQALACVTDIRDETAVAEAVTRTVERFGGIDILVNNASAISLTGTLETPMKRYDLMHQVNARGTFLCSRLCVPHLKRASNPHILNLAPPLNIESKWFAPHVAYTMAKFGMSLCVLGMHEEFRGDGIAVNALWPATGIDTEAIRLIAGQEARRRCRLPTIMADAAHWILTQPSRTLTGQFLIDDDVVRRAGISDLSIYRYPGVSEEELIRDFFV